MPLSTSTGSKSRSDEVTMEWTIGHKNRQTPPDLHPIPPENRVVNSWTNHNLTISQGGDAEGQLDWVSLRHNGPLDRLQCDDATSLLSKVNY